MYNAAPLCSSCVATLFRNCLRLPWQLFLCITNAATVVGWAVRIDLIASTLGFERFLNLAIFWLPAVHVANHKNGDVNANFFNCSDIIEERSGTKACLTELLVRMHRHMRPAVVFCGSLHCCLQDTGVWKLLQLHPCGHALLPLEALIKSGLMAMGGCSC